MIRHGKQWHQEFICKVRKKSPQEGSVYLSDFMILKRWRKSRRWREVRYELIIGRYVGLCREQNSISIDVIYKNRLSQ